MISDDDMDELKPGVSERLLSDVGIYSAHVYKIK